jgi:hypothetical protein
VKNYTVKQYQESDYECWNTFVNQAKNATFLFHRDFMEYHKDRFEDYSRLRRVPLKLKDKSKG